MELLIRSLKSLPGALESQLGWIDTDALPWTIIVPSVVVGYLTLVQVVRFRALHKMERKYAAYISDPYKLNYKQAREIMQLSLLRDHPFSTAFGTQWALIKSYGIATGTPLLVKTKQLCDKNKVGKRVADTSVFLREFLVGDIDDERGIMAMSKLNWLHHRFDISEGDYVHTLALFVLEPQRWIEKYEWRPMTNLEKVAQFLFWRELGHRMGFGGIPETLEELAEWRVEYEKTHLYYIKENGMVMEATLNVFLSQIPKFMHGFMRNIIISFLEEKEVRVALGLGDPPLWASALTHGVLRARAVLIRHFFLPRFTTPDPLPKAGPDGRLRQEVEFAGFEPWYVADTWYNRFLARVKLGADKVPSKKYWSNGFLPEELGPIGLEKVSREPVHKQAKEMEEYVRQGGSAVVGCPFNFGW